MALLKSLWIHGYWGRGANWIRFGIIFIIVVVAVVVISVIVNITNKDTTSLFIKYMLSFDVCHLFVTSNFFYSPFPFFFIFLNHLCFLALPFQLCRFSSFQTILLFCPILCVHKKFSYIILHVYVHPIFYWSKVNRCSTWYVQICIRTYTIYIFRYFVVFIFITIEEYSCKKLVDWVTCLSCYIVRQDVTPSHNIGYFKIFKRPMWVFTVLEARTKTKD